MVEAENIKLHRSADKIKYRRSQSDVTTILTTLHARAVKMIKNAKYLHFGDLMNKTLHYMLMVGVNYKTTVWMVVILSTI